MGTSAIRRSTDMFVATFGNHSLAFADAIPSVDRGKPVPPLAAFGRAHTYTQAIPDVAASIEAACRQFNSASASAQIKRWPQMEAPGAFIGDAVLAEISRADFLVADITTLNFNVTYEIGFAIGRGLPVVLTRNAAFAKDEAFKEAGIYDTLLWEAYANSADLLKALLKLPDLQAAHIPIELDGRQPVFLVKPRYITESMSHLLSRLAKTRLNLRAFDPAEQTRLAAPHAIREVAKSHGVVLHLSTDAENGADVHNQRSAFVAGLANGMNKPLAFFQKGESPIPLDYRDAVTSYLSQNVVDDEIADFAAKVSASLQMGRRVEHPISQTVLEALDIGASSAENESSTLSTYFLRTDSFTHALSGKARMVVGRKGAGKTAMFLQLREKLSQSNKTLVIDLKPDGYKLIKLRESVLDLMSAGTSEHTFTAFWEYVLLLEIGHAILESDVDFHTRNDRLYEPYRAIHSSLINEEYDSSGDFSDRIARLIDRVVADFELRFGDSREVTLSNPQVTDLIYRHDLPRLKKLISSYAREKDAVWVLLDNIDKGWPTRGLSEGDVRIIRTLVEATRKIERDFHAHDAEAHSLIFLRNDVYELLVDATPDRGKEKRVPLDWYEPDLLRELLRRRFSAAGLEHSDSFEDAWSGIAVSHVGVEESSQFLIDRCLMRPRYLLDALSYCKSSAVNLGHERIEEGDFKRGVSAFSADIFEEISLEIRDVNPNAEDVLYSLIGMVESQSEDDITLRLMESGFSYEQGEALINLLLWYGVLGIVETGEDAKFIYDYKYNWKLLEAHLKRARVEKLRFKANPAFVDAIST
jgi:hypothetical protein